MTKPNKPGGPDNGRKYKPNRPAAPPANQPAPTQPPAPAPAPAAAPPNKAQPTRPPRPPYSAKPPQAPHNRPRPETAGPKQDSETATLAKQVRQLRSRTERERTGTFYIEGDRIVAQAIKAGAAITLGVAAPELYPGNHAEATVADLRASGAPVIELSGSEFESISFKENLQGVGAVLRYKYYSLDEVSADARLWVALDNVGNPGNLGAIMRTCDAVGVAGLILLGDTTDPFHPVAVRASMGSLFALKIAQAGFDEFTQWKNAHGFAVIGTTPDVDLDYSEVDYPPASILLMGSERLGLSTQQKAACDILVTIPMIGTCDSLNLGVATSIVLYEMFNKQRKAVSGQPSAVSS